MNTCMARPSLPVNTSSVCACGCVCVCAIWEFCLCRQTGKQHIIPASWAPVVPQPSVKFNTHSQSASLAWNLHKATFQRGHLGLLWRLRVNWGTMVTRWHWVLNLRSTAAKQVVPKTGKYVNYNGTQIDMYKLHYTYTWLVCVCVCERVCVCVYFRTGNPCWPVSPSRVGRIGRQTAPLRARIVNVQPGASRSSWGNKQGLFNSVQWPWTYLVGIDEMLPQLVHVDRFKIC